MSYEYQTWLDDPWIWNGLKNLIDSASQFTASARIDSFGRHHETCGTICQGAYKSIAYTNAVPIGGPYNRMGRRIIADSRLAAHAERFPFRIRASGDLLRT